MPQKHDLGMRKARRAGDLAQGRRYLHREHLERLAQTLVQRGLASPRILESVSGRRGTR